MNRFPESRPTRKIEYWLFLLCLVVVGVCYYGIRALAVYGLAVVTAILTDFICLFLRKRSYKIADLSNAGMAVTMCMMFPATVPYSIVMLSTVFSTAISHIFGYRKGYLFPPPAMGYLFALSCWKDEILKFPETGERLPLFHHQAVLSDSFSHTLITENKLPESWNHIFMGTIRSPMGTGCIFMLLIGAVVLLYRKQLSPWAFLGFLFGVSVCSFFMPIPMHETIVSSMMLFALIFLISDPAVMPCKNIMAYFGATVTALLSCYLIAVYHMEYAPVVAVMLSIPLWQWLAKREKLYTVTELEEDIPLENKFADDAEDFEEEPEELTPDEEEFEDDFDFDEDEDFEEEPDDFDFDEDEDFEDESKESTEESDKDFEEDDFDFEDDEPEEDTYEE